MTPALTLAPHPSPTHPPHPLTPKALETALRLRRGLLRRPHPPLVLGATLQGGAGLGAAALGGAASAGRSPGMQLGQGGAMGGAMPPLLRACVLLPLRMPSLFTSALLLNLLCVRGLVPATLEEVR